MVNGLPTLDARHPNKAKSDFWGSGKISGTYRDVTLCAKRHPFTKTFGDAPPQNSAFSH
jgi:hypothetical protein